ncbi:MAG TPA: ABC transporter substrate-binding protein [Bryobacteraceae bacterium]|nr:ABC transporter substrate-binding protein [Bryobacteraceae bacterium]
MLYRISCALCAFAFAVLCQEPYKDARKNPPSFSGPGSDAPEPADLTEVRLGWFGPAEGPMWEAARQAIEELNAQGGYRRLPFRLIQRWSENPWKSGAQHVIRMAYGENVWAVIAAHDGSAAHLAQQVAMKALIPLMNPVATDLSLHTAGVPWMFSCAQGDDAIARLVAKQLEGRAPVVLSSTDHDARAFLSKLMPLVKIARQIEFEGGHAGEAARAVGPGTAAVLVVAGPRDSGLAVKELRASGYTGPIAGGPQFGRAEFREAADAAAAGSHYPALADGSRFPDYAAACAYDSVQMLGAAIREAGLNRERIREHLRALPSYSGASGRIEWDGFGQNKRAVTPATY